jgi:anti-sigma regulatory factor (Ser/Thr protein kinase)
VGDVLAGRRQLAEDGMPMVTKTFPRQPESVHAARHVVKAALAEWNMSALADTAELVVSELASNAVVHARRGSFRVTLNFIGGNRVRVAVFDRSTTLPAQSVPDGDEDHGRGLAIVDAVSRQWGADPLRWGKRVWADLEMPQPPEPFLQMPMYATRRAQLLYVVVVAGLAALIVCSAATSLP